MFSTDLSKPVKVTVVQGNLFLKQNRGFTRHCRCLWGARGTRMFMRVSFFYIALMIGSQQLLQAHAALAQGLDKRITIGAENETLISVFQKIKSQTNFSFAFPDTESREHDGITFNAAERTVREVLELALRGSNLTYTLKNNVIVIHDKPGEEEAVDQNTLQEREPVKKETPFFTVTGTVKDAITQEPLIGVNIIVKNTSRGTPTDVEGRFSLPVEVGDVLVFTFVGFKTLELPVGDRSVIEVALENDVTALGEVVVKAGYYNVKDKEKTGNITKVTAEVIGKQPVTNPLGALGGRMTGVNVQQTTGVPGGDFKIEIRGRNSLRTTGNDPLYIVDGVPFSSEKVSSDKNTGTLIRGGVSPLTSINSADIESIEVLKDADATAIYGSRGANGVVLITTKKGKVGKTKVGINYFAGFANAYRVKLANTKQYLALRREAFSNDNIAPTSDPNDNRGLNGKGYAPDLMVWDTTRYTDWQKVFFGNTARTNSVQASLSDGNERTQFLLSAGYYNETSVFPGEFNFRKISSHISLNHLSASKKLFLNISTSGSVDLHEQPGQDFTWGSRFLAPNAPRLYNENGTLNWEPHPVTGQSTWVNPMAALEDSYEGDMNSIITNATIGYEIISGLKVQSNIGYNRLASDELTLHPSTRLDPAEGHGPESSEAIRSNGSSQSWIIEPQLSWEKKISKGHLSVLAGGTYQRLNHKLLSNLYSDFPSNALIRNPSASADQYVFQYTSSVYKYAALFGRINYNWDGKYILNLTGRRDGSSRFGPGRQYANFGAVGCAWIFSEESFVKNNFAFLSFGKFRGSFGLTGSDQIGNYQYLDAYEAPQQTNSYDGVTVLYPTRLHNPVFGWESNQKAEGAIELGFLNDRISLSVAYYRNRSSNQLVDYALPATTGFGGILSNLEATVQNTGVELKINTINIQSGGFTWAAEMNVTVPRNKLIRFPNLDSSTYSNTYIINKSIYIQKFFEYTGVDPSTGWYTFKDYNNDGAITAGPDARKVMFVGQDFYGGVSNIFTYGGWSLDIFLQFVRQTRIASAFFYGRFNSNFPVEFLNQDRWRKEGDHAETQRSATDYTSGLGTAFYGTPLYNYGESNAAVTDASFIRLKTVSLEYQFPDKWMKGVVSCKLYIRGQNLGVLTKYKGGDPEVAFDNLPPLRTITIGVNLTL